MGEAADGADAVAAVQAHRPDVVLMDIRMPGMDGIAATSALRRLDDSAARDRPDHVPGRRACHERASGRRRRVPVEGHRAHGDRQRRAPRGGRRSDALTVGHPHASPSPRQRRDDRSPSRRGPAPDVAHRPGAGVATAVGSGASNAEVAASLFMSEATVKGARLAPSHASSQSRTGCTSRFSCTTRNRDLTAIPPERLPTAGLSAPAAFSARSGSAEAPRNSAWSQNRFRSFRVCDSRDAHGGRAYQATQRGAPSVPYCRSRPDSNEPQQHAQCRWRGLAIARFFLAPDRPPLIAFPDRTPLRRRGRRRTTCAVRARRRGDPFRSPCRPGEDGAVVVLADGEVDRSGGPSGRKDRHDLPAFADGQGAMAGSSPRCLRCAGAERFDTRSPLSARKPSRAVAGAREGALGGDQQRRFVAVQLRRGTRSPTRASNVDGHRGDCDQSLFLGVAV